MSFLGTIQQSHVLYNKGIQIYFCFIDLVPDSCRVNSNSIAWTRQRTPLKAIGLMAVLISVKFGWIFFFFFFGHCRINIIYVPVLFW